MAQFSTSVQYVKLNIFAYSDSDYNNQNGSPFEALLNPESYTVEHKVELSDENQAQGPEKAKAQYVKTSPAVMNFDFLFDATGALNDPGNPGSTADGLAKEIRDFMQLVFTTDSSKHEPPYLKIVWGAMMFKGRFESVSINYKLFDSQGNAIRAVLKCVFRSSAPASSFGKVSSPDLTHVRVVTASDTLPLLCNTIYGSPAYYMEVARLNGIANFRKLQVGSSIYFPPLS